LKETLTTGIHPSSDIIASYVAQMCGPDVISEVEQHCLQCKDCKMKLDIVMHLCAEELSREEQQIFEAHRDALHEGVMQFLRLYRAVIAWAADTNFLEPPEDLS
jgi:hypothetical protein